MQTLLFLKQETPVVFQICLELNYIGLLEECHKVELTISPEEVPLIEKQLSSQKVMPFFRHRTGRIGASKSRAASHTDPSQVPFNQVHMLSSSFSLEHSGNKSWL